MVDDSSTESPPQHKQPIVLRMDASNSAALEMTFPMGDELTINRVKEIAESYQSVLKDASQITIDLAGVTECDTAGIQLVIAMQRYAREQEKPCKFLTPSAAISARAHRIGFDFDSFIGG